MISRREFIALLGGVATSFMFPGALKSAAVRKNFVFILVDDLGWTDLGCYGSSFHSTPSLDRLAKQGMRFTDAYTSCPVCSPTRASIMTGKYPARLNITDWIPGFDPKNRKLLGPQDLHDLPLEEETIAEALRGEGYKTFFAGKWHLGGEGFYPEDQGFDANLGGHHRGSPPGGYYVPYKNPKLPDGPEGEYLPDRLTDEAMRFLESVKGNPFFLYLSFYTVHTPIEACVRHVKSYRDKAKSLVPADIPAIPEHDGFTRQRQDYPAYASMVKAMDENVGRLMEKLDELGLAEDTVVVFTSDNGGLTTLGGKNGGPTSVLPLRAGKGWCYEGGIRVPLIVRAPGVSSPGSVCDFPVTSTDFYPTILDLAGLPLRPKQHADGLSLVSLIRGERSLKRNAIFWHYPHYHGSTWKPGAAVRAGDWKLIEFYDEGKTELYNLAEDIGERYELSAKMRGKTRQLKKMLRRWQKRVGAKMPRPNPDWERRE